MFPWTRHEPATERERYLEDELERERDANRRRDEEAEERREAARREARERHNEYMRSAADWPEALRKQATLFRNEADPDDPTQWFAHGAAACEAALALWGDVEEAHQAELDELEEKLAAVQATIRAEVAERLLAEADGREGWTQVAYAIRDIEDPEPWLDW